MSKNAQQSTTAVAGEPVVVLNGSEPDPVTQLPQSTPPLSEEPSAVSRTFTAEDLERARAQEKEKLYPRLSQMEEELERLRKEREERVAAEKAAEEARRKEAEEADARRKAEAEEEMSAKELLRQKEAEWQAQLEQERKDREAALALLQREQEYQALQEQRQQILAREQDNIVPELLDLISGNSAEELEASAAALRERSARIMESMAQATQQTRQNMPGTRITVPAAGPLDNDPDYVSNNPTDIQNMSMADYAKNRQKLLGSASTNRGQGLFG
jgi:DNA repair exonuclease SbcCD ATPase subunit